MLICYLDEGPHTVRGLAATLEISKPAITRSLDRLVELNLARRVSIGKQLGLWRKVGAVFVGDHAALNRRARSRSSFARPYIWRLTSFSLVFCPSV
jgi:predicted transcriptional regulator